MESRLIDFSFSVGQSGWVALQIQRQEFFFTLSHYVMAGDILLIQSLAPAGGVAHATLQQNSCLVGAGHLQGVLIRNRSKRMATNHDLISAMAKMQVLAAGLLPQGLSPALHQVQVCEQGLTAGGSTAVGSWNCSDIVCSNFTQIPG